MTDLIVVVPGILGSTLSRDGSQIWGYAAMLRHPRLLGTRLALRDGDTAEPTGLLRLPVQIPGLSKLDTYGPVLDSLTSQFDVEYGDNLVPFAYDWRRSCRDSAAALGQTVDRELQRWRLASNNEHAGVILLCHSMGGIVARWYLDVIMRNQPVNHVRTLITIGTPYRGSVKAVGAVVNGVLGWTGATGRRLSEALRGFPSVYELLPNYDCVDTDNGNAKPVELPAAEIAWPSTDFVAAAADFHAELAAAPVRYDLHAIASKMQRTAHRVHVDNPERVTVLERDESGDGTVPREGAQPYGWRSMAAAKWIDQKHATMHNGSDAWTQFHGIMTEEWVTEMSLFTGLSLTVPDAIPAGTALHISVMPTSAGSTPLLQLDVTDAETGEQIDQRLLDEADGHYTASITALTEGTYRVEVHDPSGIGGVTPISDLVTVT